MACYVQTPAVALVQISGLMLSSSLAANSGISHALRSSCLRKAAGFIFGAPNALPVKSDCS